MSDGTVANLGFAVDSGGLDQAKQKLGGLTDQAKQTEQQANKTSDALNKMGAGSAASGIGKTAQSVEQLAASLVKATDAAGKNLSVSAQIDQLVAKTGVSYTAANAAIKAAVDAHNSSAAAATKNSEALGGVATQATRAAPAISAVATSVAAASNSFGGSSLTLAAFGAAAAGAASAITRAGDDVYRATARFGALTGSARDGAAVFDIVKRSANATGVEFGTFATAIERALQGTDKLNNSWPVITIGANKASSDIAGLNSMFTTLAKIMQNAGSTAEEEAQALGALGAGIGKTGGLTVDTFQRILDLSPPLARAISNAFGYQNINDFEKALANTVIPVRDLEQAMSRIAPWADRNFDPTKPKTFEQATRGVVAAWNELLQTMAQTGAFDGVKTALSTISQILRQDAQDAAALANAIKAAANAAGQGISVATNSGSGGFGSDISGGAGIPGSYSTNSDYGSSPYSYDNSSYINDSVAAGFLGSQDYSVGNPAGDLPGFATGGSFVVGGSGGTDSQLVQFMATPGEMVTIDPSGSSAPSISGLMPASDQPDIASLLQKQTESIVSAINDLKSSITGSGGNANSAASSKTTSALSVNQQYSGFSMASGGGGGKGSSKSQDQSSSQQPTNAPQIAQPASPLSPWANWGTARAIGGYQGNSFAAGQPLNPDGTPVSGLGGGSAGGAGALDPRTLTGRSPENERMSALDNVYTQDQFSSYMNQQLTDLKRDFDSQAALNDNIGQQNGGVKTPRDYGSPTGVSTNYPPPVLGHYDDNMAFVPNNPSNVGPGMMPKTNDYTYAGQTNPFPYQPGISTPVSFPKYFNALKGGGIDGIPLPQPRPPEADAKTIGDQTQSAIKDGTEATRTVGNDTINKLGDTSSQQVSAIDSNGRTISDAVNASGESTSKAISDGMASLGNEIASALASIGGSGAGRAGATGGLGSTPRIPGLGGPGLGGRSSGASGNGYGDYGDYGGVTFDDGGAGNFGGLDTGFGSIGASGGDGSSPFETGTSSYNDYGASDFGLSGGYSNNDLGVGGSSVSDVANQYMSSSGGNYTSSGGFDALSYDDSAGFSGLDNIGNFKTGGQFTVGGDGGTDTTPIFFHATKGETVTITPRDVSVPSSVAVPNGLMTPSSNTQSAPQQQAAPQTNTTTVNMYLHPGVQAEQVLRSRAQIARAWAA